MDIFLVADNQNFSKNEMSYIQNFPFLYFLFHFCATLSNLITFLITFTFLSSETLIFIKDF